METFSPRLDHRGRSACQCSIDYSRDNTSNRNHPAGTLLTPKAFDNKAQGRRARGAPWVRNERDATNPNGPTGLNMRPAG